jgi:hypothetical protein
LTLEFYKCYPVGAYAVTVLTIFSFILSLFYCSITVVVGSIPNSDPSGRLILLPKASAQDSGLSSSKRAKKKSDHKVGSFVEAEVQPFF